MLCIIGLGGRNAPAGRLAGSVRPSLCCNKFNGNDACMYVRFARKWYWPKLTTQNISLTYSHNLVPQSSLKHYLPELWLIHVNQHMAINKSLGGEKRWPKQCSRNTFSISSISPHNPHPKDFSKNEFASWDMLATRWLSILRSCGWIPFWSWNCFAEELLSAHGLLHAFCFSAVWILRCFIRVPVSVNILLQTKQIYGLSPIWVFKCVFR